MNSTGWILMVLLAAGPSDNTTLSMQYFATRRACEEARAWVKTPAADDMGEKDWRGRPVMGWRLPPSSSRVRAACLPEGDP